MIYGIGTDIASVMRIQQSVEKNPRFAEKLFTPLEQAYCEARGSKYQSYAARFAAKEAVMKAFGTGWSERVHWKNIEVIKEGDKAPAIRLHEDTLELANELGIRQIHLSLSHEKEYAIAFVVMEQ